MLEDYENYHDADENEGNDDYDDDDDDINPEDDPAYNPGASEKPINNQAKTFSAIKVLLHNGYYTSYPSKPKKGTKKLITRKVLKSWDEPKLVNFWSGSSPTSNGIFHVSNENCRSLCGWIDGALVETSDKNHEWIWRTTDVAQIASHYCDSGLKLIETAKHANTMPELLVDLSYGYRLHPYESVQESGFLAFSPKTGRRRRVHPEMLSDDAWVLCTGSKKTIHRWVAWDGKKYQLVPAEDWSIATIAGKRHSALLSRMGEGGSHFVPHIVDQDVSWDHYHDVLSLLKDRLALTQWNVSNILPVYMRYYSDGDWKSQEDHQGYVCSFERKIAAILMYEGPAWAVSLTFGPSNYLLPGLVFVHKDGSVISADWCMRQRAIKGDGGINLYVTGHDILSWCLGPGMTRIPVSIVKRDSDRRVRYYYPKEYHKALIANRTRLEVFTSALVKLGSKFSLDKARADWDTSGWSLAYDSENRKLHFSLGGDAVRGLFGWMSIYLSKPSDFGAGLKPNATSISDIPTGIYCRNVSDSRAMFSCAWEPTPSWLHIPLTEGLRLLNLVLDKVPPNPLPAPSLSSWMFAVNGVYNQNATLQETMKGLT